jgi:hypothetical protein
MGVGGFMRKKIGEILIEQGLITAAQLSTALTSQLIFGGHLGTCLLDLGMIDEDRLGKALEVSAGVPYAPGPTLANIPSEVIRALPRRLAERYQAVPIERVDDSLHVAMVDPRNVRAIDDMAFSSGYKISPWISPEVRILEALEKYYGAPRRPRYIRLSRMLEEAVERKLLALFGQDSINGADSPGRTRDGRRVSDMESCCSVPNMGGEFGFGRSWREIAVELELARSAKAEVAREGNTPRPSTPVPGDMLSPTIWDTTQRLTRVEDKQQAVAALLDFTAARMERSVFLGVNDDIASVWDSRGHSFDRRRRDRAAFEIGSERLFDLMRGSDSYRGPLPTASAFRDFYKALGMPFPAEILMLPIHVNDHLVATLYGDGGEHGSILGETDEFVRLIRVFSSSMELLLLKERMQMIGGGSAEPADDGKPSAAGPDDGMRDLVGVRTSRAG